MEKLNDLHKTLALFGEFTGPIGSHCYDGIDDIAKGFSLCMTRTETSVNSRNKKSIHFAHHLQFFFHLAENRVYAKKLSSI